MDAADAQGGVVLRGCTTEPAAVEALLARAAELVGSEALRDAVVRLPDPDLGSVQAALVRSALAPLHPEPNIKSAAVTQYVLGHRLDLLAREGGWWRVRGEDGYLGWVHDGFLETGDEEWARQWELGEDGEPMVSLGTRLLDDGERPFARLPWGARIIRDQPRRYRLPDGRRGELEDETRVIAADRMSDRFPPRGESVVRTARTWWGTPYIWSGVIPAGADCSGFVQSVFWMHGIALPRDSDLQARQGEPLDPGDLQPLRPADLLFFAEEEGGRVTHVGLSLGGPDIIHCSVSNGGVEVNRVGGDLPLDQRLARELVAVRRILPD